MSFANPIPDNADLPLRSESPVLSPRMANRAGQACTEMFKAFATNNKEVPNRLFMNTIDFLRLAKALRLYPVSLLALSLKVKLVFANRISSASKPSRVK